MESLTRQTNNTSYKKLRGGSKNRMLKRKRRNPLVLVFDEDARKEFLTGFRKRKLHRKKLAQEELEKKLKEEKKRIKREAKDAYKKMIMTNRDVPEIQEFNTLSEGDDNSGGMMMMTTATNTIDMETHSVQITELDPAHLAKQNDWIGINNSNSLSYDVTEEGEVSSRHQALEQSASEICNYVEGMDLVPNKTSTQVRKVARSQKDLKKLVKRVATKELKKSKVFQMKSHTSQIRNRKKMHRLDRRRKKTMRQRQTKDVE